MDKQKKSRYSFNLIDVFLIIVFLLAAVLLIYNISTKKIVAVNSKNTVQIEYSITIPELRDDLRNAISIGDEITDSDTGKKLGEIKNVMFSQYYYEGTNKTNGERVRTAVPGTVSVTVTVSAGAEQYNNGYAVNGTRIILGKSLSFHTAYFESAGTVTLIR